MHSPRRKLPMPAQGRGSTGWSRVLLPLFLTAALVPPALAKFDNDFSGYSQGAQPCLYDASDSSNCDGDTVPAMNKCLCSDGGDFVTNSARCIAAESPGDLQDTYDTLSTHCSDSETPLGMSEQEFLAIASRATATMAVASPTATATPSKTTGQTTHAGTQPTITGASATASSTAGSSDSDSDSDSASGSDSGKQTLSTNTKVAIAAASVISAGAVAAIVAWFFLWRRHTGPSHKDETHPMLPTTAATMPMPMGGGPPGTGTTAVAWASPGGLSPLMHMGPANTTGAAGAATVVSADSSRRVSTLSPGGSGGGLESGPWRSSAVSSLGASYGDVPASSPYGGGGGGGNLPGAGAGSGWGPLGIHLDASGGDLGAGYGMAHMPAELAGEMEAPARAQGARSVYELPSTGGPDGAVSRAGPYADTEYRGAYALPELQMGQSFDGPWRR